MKIRRRKLRNSLIKSVLQITLLFALMACSTGLDTQMDAVLDKAGAAALGRAVIAYEPVWAIGTGKTPTPHEVAEIHAFIRGEIGKLLGKDVADKMRILYGGSVKSSNAVELMSLLDVDGALVGGASLKADEFCSIIETRIN